MEKTLSFRIKCGETTCAESPGVFCKYVGVTGMCGKSYVCLLFPLDENQVGYKKSQSSTPLTEENGWLMRCQKCMEAE